MAEAPLEGLRVVDLSTTFAGALATMILSDAGADVIKVEPAGGEPTWAQPAARQWHRGKRSVACDIATAEGKCRALDLIGGADVVVESAVPGELEQVGIDGDELLSRHGGLIWVSITGFGREGPLSRYPVSEGIVSAKAGRYTQLEGILPRPGPIYGAVPVAGFGAAMTALQGLMAALYVRERCGIGQRVDASLLRGLSVQDLGQWLVAQLPEEEIVKISGDGRTDGIYKAVYLAGRTKDGRWIQLGNTAAHLFMSCMQVMGLEDVYTNPRYSDAPYYRDVQIQDELQSMLLARVREKTLGEWMELFIANGNVGAEPLQTTQEGMEHPQMLHNGHVVTVDDPVVGPTRQIAPLARLSETPMRIRGPAATPGAHTDAVIENGDTRRPERPARSGNRSATPKHALDDVLVLNFASWIAGSMASLPLADLGARVIKIEPLEGDPYRYSGEGEGVAHTSAGMEGLALNLKSEEGRAIALELVRRADILIHNWRPGVAERLGLGHDAVRAINPRCVYVHASSYGRDGPHAHRPMFHPLAGAIAGNALYQAGEGMLPDHNEEIPMEELREISRELGRSNEPNPDPNAGMGCACAALLALLVRERSGVAQHVETTMILSNAYSCSDDFLDYEGKPARPAPDAGKYGLQALYRLYESRESWVFLDASGGEAAWTQLCEALERPDLPRDPRFRVAEERRANDAALAEELTAIFASRQAEEWERKLIGAGVGCVRADGPTYSRFSMFDPHSQATGLSEPAEWPHRRYGAHRRHGPVVALSRTPGRARPGCELGEHTQAILEEIGYAPDAIAGLREREVVGLPD